MVDSLRKAKLSVYHWVYIPTLTYYHELWVMAKRMRSQIQAAEISFLRRVAGYTLLDWVRSLVTLEASMWWIQKDIIPKQQRHHPPACAHNDLLTLPTPWHPVHEQEWRQSTLVESKTHTEQACLNAESHLRACQLPQWPPPEKYSLTPQKPLALTPTTEWIAVVPKRFHFLIIPLTDCGIYRREHILKTDFLL